METAARPLTFGQLSTLRALQKWPKQRWPEGNLVHRHTVVDPRATAQDVRTALATVARHHGAMRTTFDLDDVAHPAHVVHDDVPPGLLVVASADEAEEVARTAPLTNFDYGTDRGWQAFLTLDRAGRPNELILCMSHLVFDGWSMRHVDLELTPLIGGTFDWDHSRTSLHTTADLGRLQRGDAWADRRAAAQAHWEGFFRAAPAHRLLVAGVGAEAAHVTRGVLGLEHRHHQLVAISRRAKVFPAGIVLALLSLALMRTCDDELLPMALMTANRNIPIWRDVVTTLNQQIPALLRRPSAAEPVSAYLAEVQRDSVDAHRNGAYDVDMADRVAQEIFAAVPRSFGPLLNFTTHRGAAGPPPAEPAAQPVVTPSAQGIPTDIYIAVSNTGGLSIDLFAVDRILPADAVRASLQWISDALTLIAQRESLRIGDLMALA